MYYREAGRKKKADGKGRAGVEYREPGAGPRRAEDRDGVTNWSIGLTSDHSLVSYGSHDTSGIYVSHGVTVSGS